jgi:hypothetical protein
MAIRQLLTLAALSALIGACGFITPGQADSTNPVRVLAQNSPQPNQSQQQRPSRPRIDFAAAAAKLGVSEAQLKTALGVSNTNTTTGQKPRRLDIPGAATKLGVTEQQLVEALGIPPRPPRPNFAEAASKLGVSEAQLKEALGVPANPPTEGDRQQRPPRPDLASAAAKLGVTEQQLVEALGIPPRPPGHEQR